MILYNMSSAIEDRNRIVHKNVTSKAIKGIGNNISLQEYTVNMATERALHKHIIPKVHDEGYNGAKIVLSDSSTNDVFTLNSERSKDEEILGLKFKRNLDSNSSFINQEKTKKKESLRTINMTMPKGWKDPVDIARKEAEDKARKEAEAIEHATIIKESIPPQQQDQTIIQKNLTRSEQNTNNLRNDVDSFAANMTSWQYSTVAWIDMYKEFAINAAKLSEYWFNIFWSPWTAQQRKDKVKIE